MSVGGLKHQVLLSDVSVGDFTGHTATSISTFLHVLTGADLFHSNTKVNLFVGYAEALEPFRQVIQQSSSPNALTALKKLPQEKGCQISYAADMTQMLSLGLAHNPQVEQRFGVVTGADWDDEVRCIPAELSTGGLIYQ